MGLLALSAIGKDRPGIVAGVTKVLFELGCNLADCSMTLLSGQFAMILLVEAPDAVPASHLEEALTAPATDLGLTFSLREVAAAESPESLHPFVISVYGGDRPGIVYRVAAALAGRGVNVTDLVSRVASGVYTVMLDVDLPSSVEPDALAAELADLAKDLGVVVAMRPAETEEL
ncbi:MAG TPA: ACT domain-containing protein [Actinomycetota bacterium]|nr:ACT domain-containing protein [Actinomycetota bacterium]